MKQQSSGKGFAVLSAASVICKVFSLAYLPFQTWIVGDVGNGIISKGYNLYVFLYGLTNAGLPIVISKFVSEHTTVEDYQGASKTFRCAFSVMMALGTIAALMTFVFADWIAVNLCTQPKVALMLRMIAPTFLFTSLSGALRGYYQGRRNMTPTAVSLVIEQILNSVLTVVFIKLFYDYAVRIHQDAQSYAAAGSALGTVIGAAGSASFLIFLFMFVYRKQRISEYRQQKTIHASQSSFKIYRRIILFAIPAVISAIAASAIDLIDIKSITQMLQAGGFSPEAAVSLFGIYSTKYQKLFQLAAITFATPLVTSMIPALSSALAQGNKKYFHDKIGESYRLIFMTILPIIAGLSFLAQPVITLIFAHQNNGAQLVMLGTWIAVFSTVQIVQSGILMSMGHPLVSPLTTLIGILAKLFCNYTLIRMPGINIYGAIIGNAATWLVAICLNQIYIQYKTQQKVPFIRHMMIPAAVSLVMGAACLGIFQGLYLGIGSILPRGVIVSDLSILITVIAGAFIYALLMIRTGGIQSDDILKLPMGGQLYTFLKNLPLVGSKL